MKTNIQYTIIGLILIFFAMVGVMYTLVVLYGIIFNWEIIFAVFGTLVFFNIIALYID